MTIKKTGGRSVELLRLQSGNRSNDKESCLQQQLSNPLGNVMQTLCLSACTEIQITAQSDAFITIKINTLSVKADIACFLTANLQLPRTTRLPTC